MRSGCRGSAPRENSRFQLRTQPCRRGGGVCRCLLSPTYSALYLLSNIGARTAMRLSRMTCNYRPSFLSRFSCFSFFLSFLPGPLPNVSAGGQANHRATTRERAELCALRMNDTRTWGRHLARNLLEASPRNQVTMYGLECHSEKSDTSLLSMRQKRLSFPRNLFCNWKYWQRITFVEKSKMINTLLSSC